MHLAMPILGGSRRKSLSRPGPTWLDHRLCDSLTSTRTRIRPIGSEIAGGHVMRCRIAVFVTSAFLFVGLTFGPAFAHRLSRPAGHLGAYLPPYRAAISGTWTPLTRAFPGAHPDTALLLQDGTVAMHDACTPNWYRLRPNSKGNYLRGTWDAKAAVMPHKYAPLYFASQVGVTTAAVVVNGGEYNGAIDGGTCTVQAETATSAIFDAYYENAWYPLSGPAKWKTIGDAPSVLLTDAQNTHPYMLGRSGDPNTKQQARFGTPDYHWLPTGAGKADANEEEGWTLLQNGYVFTVDTNLGLGQNSPSELYDQKSETWSAAATAPNVLVDAVHHEIGPAVVLPNGHVFQVGASPCGDSSCKAHTAIYIPDTGNIGRWVAGPDFPAADAYYDSADGPAALLTNGHVLVQASPGYGYAPSRFFEFDEADGKHGTLTRVSEPTSAPGCASYQSRMLVLPSGQILWSSDGYTNSAATCSADVELYTPKGAPDPAWKPIIGDAPTTLTRGSQNNEATGTLFMGLSQGAAYGDDAQMATNYPILTVTNSNSGNVCFLLSGFWYAYLSIDWVHAETISGFNVPQNCETGPGQFRIIANGIASDPWSVQTN